MIQGRGRLVQDFEFVAEIDARDRVTKKKQRLKSGGDSDRHDYDTS